MADYQPAHNLNPSHPGEKNPKIQSTGAPHPAQQVQGAMDNLTAQTLPTKTRADNEAGEAIGTPPPACVHARINFSPTHICATCKEATPNNCSLERHASQARHKAFLCNCTMEFVRLATLNRHIAAQAGPKHHCGYCDDNRGFAREDKLIDHLRASHKFGEKAIAQFRSQARSQSGANGLASPTTTTPGTSLAISTSTGHQTAQDVTATGLQGLPVYSTGPPVDPIGVFHNGVVNHSAFNDAGIQPFSIAGHHLLPNASGDVAGLNVFGGGVQDDHFARFNVSVPGLSSAGISGVNPSDVNFFGADLAGVDFTEVGVDLDFAGVDVDLDIPSMGTGI